jgi:hypothetical protein
MGAALVLPEVNAEAVSLHLAAISRRVAPGAHAVAVLDGAGWHQPGGRLLVPGNITLRPLPPSAPGLNGMENLWGYLRQDHLSHCGWNTSEAIVEACCEAWNTPIQMPETLASLTSRTWAKAVSK